jgi:VWFA-related protein
MRKIFLYLAVGVSLASAGRDTVGSALPASSPSQVAFRSAVNQVVLDVVVTDRNDQPVEGLTKDDFEIRQGGRVQAINRFEWVSVPLGDRSFETANAYLADIAPVSNMRPSSDSRLFAFVLDEATLQPEDFVPVERHTQRFLQRLTSADRVSVTFIGRSDLSQDFTADPKLVIRAAKNLSAAFGSGVTRVDDPGVGRAISTGDDLALVAVLENSINTLMDAAEPRRAIVLVSRATYPSRGRHHFEWIRMYENARRAGVPIYTIDPSGLAAPELGLDLPLELQTPGGRALANIARRSGHNTMREIAVNTGGRALVNRADSLEAVDGIVAENGSYYAIGFEPNPYVADGRFHDVEVRVRRTGLKVRARRGYWSQAAAQTPSDIGLELGRALEHGTPGGRLGLTGSAMRVDSSGATILTTDVDMEPWRASSDAQEVVELAWMALDAEGELLRISGRRHSLTIPRKESDAVTSVSVIDRVEIPMSATVVRVAAYSHQRQVIGRIHVPIGRWQQSSDSVEATPMALGVDPTATLRLSMFAGARELLPFPPSTRRDFSSHEFVHVLCRVFGASVELLSAEMSVQTGERELMAVPTVVEPSRFAPGAVDILGSITMSELPLGTYRLDLTVTGVNQGLLVRRAVDFEVR